MKSLILVSVDLDDYRVIVRVPGESEALLSMSADEAESIGTYILQAAAAARNLEEARKLEAGAGVR